MKKACKYCGKIHDRGYVCEAMAKARMIPKNSKEIDDFRGSTEWKRAREMAKRRDRYICAACFNNFPGTLKRLNTDALSVHHIIPLKDRYDLRTDWNNLITLCQFHHEMAENGEISADSLKKIIPPEG